MREMANRLEHMGCINRDMRLLVAMVTPPYTDHIGDRLLAMRADFGYECSQLLNQLTAMLGDHDRALLASRILDRFVAMQQVLTRHQQRWTLAEVEKDATGYSTCAQGVQAAVINFLEEALDALETAARPVRSRAPATSVFAHSPPVRLTGTH